MQEVVTIEGDVLLAAFVLMACFYAWMLLTLKYRNPRSRLVRVALFCAGLAAAGFLYNSD
jgi:cytochrome c oxidase assembly factor CtaG